MVEISMVEMEGAAFFAPLWPRLGVAPTLSELMGRLGSSTSQVRTAELSATDGLPGHSGGVSCCPARGPSMCCRFQASRIFASPGFVGDFVGPGIPTSN